MGPQRPWASDSDRMPSAGMGGQPITSFLQHHAFFSGAHAAFHEDKSRLQLCNDADHSAASAVGPPPPGTFLFDRVLL